MNDQQRENLTKWIAALESGKYKQTSLVYRNSTDCFCVLGVGIDVVDPSGWRAARGGYWTYPKITASSALWFSETFGITEKQANTLVQYNDSENQTFAELAQTLRRWQNHAEQVQVHKGC